ncbi:MAG: glycosyltransferase [Bacteroidetes bacterium]|nr:glycosyltransferase [Bacteroidota bacterium]
MRYSFILPVRNGGAYIKECVASILAQTLQDFNLIILENKSTDGTAEWLQNLKDERITVMPSSKSLSIEENWARILSIPKNEFITLTGHDDLFDSNYLQVMNDMIIQHPDASLYQAYFRFIDAKGEEIKKSRLMDEKETVSQFLYSLFRDSIDTMGTGYMMRSKDYVAVGGMPAFPNLLFADHTLWIKLTALNYKATAQQECFSYRIHENLSKHSAASSYINAFFNYLNFLDSIKSEDIKIKTVIDENITPYILYYCRSLAHRLLKTPVEQRKGMTVSGFINKCIYYNNLLAEKELLPLNYSKIKSAKMIDDNLILRKAYLLFRKIYKKPIYS